jgi:hypothetical protein
MLETERQTSTDTEARERDMHRRPSTQDLTWLLDLHQNGQLDLDPPYQRRSVWTRKDKQFFLDTIFRNFPSPAIFLHKTIDESGKATYHVVDGKQRTQTILEFVALGRLRLANDYGDIRLDGKKWSELEGEQSLKQRLWNYQITVEMIDVVDGSVINEVFDRLNRNARKLTDQELRHAKYEGWLINEVETESTREEWRTLGVVTTARAKRMVDSQFISELMLVVLEGKVLGFDQQLLNELYAKYDDPSESAPEFNQETFSRKLEETKAYLLQMERHAGLASAHARGFGNLYTLWSLVALTPDLPPADDLAERYVAFMSEVQLLSAQADLAEFLRSAEPNRYKYSLAYLNNSRGASTDLAQRTERLNALKDALLGTAG